MIISIRAFSKKNVVIKKPDDLIIEPLRKNRSNHNKNHFF
ncbi:hypothetical protein PROVRUST_06595 [Providencia rustigianii DSM 4541]|uniref:Uncharacterized protein n=1 Tax=Providencia rustigianii DSM 4541 TaxID=500637 RepID=D1P310_9GAMM|nr:hypothetical protein PROVRUST_06595 [Providencia rustigianii DSM 4541]